MSTEHVSPADCAKVNGPNAAIFSPDASYRYMLSRVWDLDNDRRVTFIGLNPSTADETQDDPTIRRCRNFAAGWGYGGMFMLNIFAYRSTDPKVLAGVEDPVGPNNDMYLRYYAARSERAIAAWGTHGRLLGRERAISELELGELLCLGVTADGHPKHPLYLKRDTALIPYEFRS